MASHHNLDQAQPEMNIQTASSINNQDAKVSLKIESHHLVNSSTQLNFFSLKIFKIDIHFKYQFQNLFEFNF